MRVVINALLAGTFVAASVYVTVIVYRAAEELKKESKWWDTKS